MKNNDIENKTTIAAIIVVIILLVTAIFIGTAFTAYQERNDLTKQTDKKWSIVVDEKNINNTDITNFANLDLTFDKNSINIATTSFTIESLINNKEVKYEISTGDILVANGALSQNTSKIEVKINDTIITPKNGKYIGTLPSRQKATVVIKVTWDKENIIATMKELDTKLLMIPVKTIISTK